MGESIKQTARFAGVIVSKNPYELPDGSLHHGTLNMSLTADDALRSRTGLTNILRQEAMDKLFSYAGRILTFAPGSGTLNVLKADFSGVDYAADTALSHLDAQTKIQGALAGERLFLTTDTGVRALDGVAGAAGRAAGGPLAPGITSVSFHNKTENWLADQKRVAYRYVLVRLLPTGTQVVGAPSGRRLGTNTSGSTSVPRVRCVLPPNLSDNVFIQLYRSATVDVGFEPDDDLKLVYERALTASECQNSLAIIDDKLPDVLRQGEFIYTAPNAGEGALAANLPPPRARIIAAHKSRLWLGDTKGPHEFIFRLLAVNTATGLNTGDRLLISCGSSFYIEVGVDFPLYTAGSASQNIEENALRIVAAINVSPTNGSVWAEYLSGPDDVPGEIRIYNRSAADDSAITVLAAENSGGAMWTSPLAYSPQLEPYLLGVSVAVVFDLARVANVVTATVTAGNITNALQVGQRVVITPTGSGSFGLGPHIITGVTGTTFTYAETGVNDTLLAQSMAFYTDEPLTSEREVVPGRVHFSKFLEYEAFPPLNYLDVGEESQKVLALASTRETLWVFKEDGLFRVTGDDEQSFDIERVDSTIIAHGPEVVKAFGEKIVAWTTKGVVQLSESSFDIISLPLAPIFEELERAFNDSAHAFYGTAHRAFMVVDEAQQLVRLHLPGDSRDDDGTVAGCGEALVFAARTGTWSRWAWKGPIYDGQQRWKPLRHGLVHRADGQTYYCDSVMISGGEGFLRRDGGFGSGVTSDDNDDDPTSTPHTIKRRAIWSFQHARAPAKDKRWNEVAFLLAFQNEVMGTPALPPPFTYGFGNELAQFTNGEAFLTGQIWFPNVSAYTTAVPVIPVVRSDIPIDFARGQRLFIGVEQDSKDDSIELHGFSISFEVLGREVVR